MGEAPCRCWAREGSGCSERTASAQRRTSSALTLRTSASASSALNCSASSWSTTSSEYCIHCRPMRWKPRTQRASSATSSCSSPRLARTHIWNLWYSRGRCCLARRCATCRRRGSAYTPITVANSSSGSV